MKTNRVAVGIISGSDDGLPNHHPKNARRTSNKGGFWHEYLDSTSNKLYYYNSRTNETQWEMPKGFTFVEHNINSPRTPTHTFEMEKANPVKFTRQSANSWTDLSATTNKQKAKKSQNDNITRKTQKGNIYSKMFGICCIVFLICGVIFFALLLGKNDDEKNVRIEGNNVTASPPSVVTTTLSPATSGTTTIASPPSAVLNPTRLVGQELQITGITLQQVNDNLHDIKIGIGKSLNVAYDDVIIESVNVFNRRRTRQYQRRRELLKTKVAILYKIKTLNDAAVKRIMTIMKSNVVKSKILEAIIQAVPNINNGDISLSCTNPISEVYNAVSATTTTLPANPNFHWSECVNSSLLQKQPANYPKNVSSGSFILPKSTVNMILTMKKIFAHDCSTVPVARSYDGNIWEGIYPYPHDPSECNLNTKVCKVQIKNDGVSYRIDAYELSANEIRTYNETISRFLMQATYGPSQDSINDFIKSHGEAITQSTVLHYINKQMNMIPPTLLRRYYRERTNPRTPVNSAAGVARHFCEPGSRFHRFSFNQLDLQKSLNISHVNGKYELRIDGILRTEVDTLSNGGGGISTGNTYVICKVEEWSGTGIVAFYKSDNTCGSNMNKNPLYIINPLIKFTNPNLEITQTFGENDVDVVDLNVPTEDSIIIKKYKSACAEAQIHGNSFIQLSGRVNDKTFYKHDPRLKLIDNSFENPANISAFQDQATMCPSVPKTFLNRHKCVRLKKACTPLQFTSGILPLNSSNLRLWYTANKRHVHYITGLRLESPYDVNVCKHNGYTRWKKLNQGPCSGGITSILQGTTTNDTIVNALISSIDTNPYVRDIEVYFKNNAGCDKSLNIDVNGIGAKVEADNYCWQHIHPDEYNVYDFTYWTNQHDGNKIAFQNGRPNPITKFALDGKVEFVYPGHHQMNRWKQKVDKFIPRVGRYGDSVNFESLNSEVQTYELAKIANAVSSDGSDGYESCGSPGEVKNIPQNLHLYRFPSRRLDLGIDANTELDFPHYRAEGKHMVWLNVALNSPDQLRQKVAWALSQILVISESGLNSKNDEIENWIMYYDNFVRNAFKSYRTVLREVTYSPMMGKYLTYMQNKAYKFAKTFPDENYAREIMQLFTIGLWKLNIDGTYKLDGNGEKQETYTNDDIVSFARIWTGFDRALTRSNVEHQNGLNSDNYFDPMQLKPEWRDFFPKRALDKGFIGDGYPLCNDLPKNEFLLPGSVYVNTGTHSDEGKYYDDGPPTHHYRQQFTPSNNGSSDLFNKLCSRKTSGGPCTFPDKITLSDKLQCNGDECDIDFIRTVKLVDSSTNKINYYTYQRQPCVRLTFFEGKVTVDTNSLNENNIDQSYQCTNPHAKGGGAACCDSNGNMQQLPYKRTMTPTACNFALEFMTYNTTKSRCEKLGWQVCENVVQQNWGWSFKRGCGPYLPSWTSKSCNYQIQVLSSGYTNAVYIDGKRPEYAMNNENTFLLRWKNNSFPTVTDSGCGFGCKAVGTSCICNLTIVNSIGFKSLSTTSSTLPSVEVVEKTLHIGAYSPTLFYNVILAGTYSLCTTAECNTHYSNHKVHIYTHFESSQQLDEKTIFELPSKIPGGNLRYFINKVSTVHVGDNYEFRNPPNFLPNLGETYTYRGEGFPSKFHVAQATYEVEALLDHLVEHPNTAPFISHRLIQRLVTSNPSPRYVKAVATAFINGKTSDGTIYTGKYGDIGAAVAEILLDHEARSTTLDADPLAGKLREPLLKVVGFMRAMKYESKDAREVNLYDIDTKIGQNVFASPTVFNFFLPEFVPPGPVYEAKLVSPEAQLSTTPYLIGFLNGMESLIRLGLTTCDRGFGDFNARPRRKCNSALYKYKTNDGTIKYTPSEFALQKGVAGIIDEVDLLLTTGRLNKNDKLALIKTYQDTYASSNGANSGEKIDAALKAVLRLLIMTSEFHTSAVNRIKSTTRALPSITPSQHRPYKAIIVLFQAGAADSFNMIVPHSECGNTHDLHQEYLDVRTNVALPKSSLLAVNVPKNTQPCNRFGIHPSLQILKTQYDAGNASFIANMGALVEPLTKAEFEAKSKRLPPSLFAHNIMQRAMHTVHAQDAASNGILGRIVKTVAKKQIDKSNNVVLPYRSNMYSLGGNQRMLEGAAPGNIPFIIDKKSGVVKFLKYNTMSRDIANVSKSESENIFAETFSSTLETSLRQTEHLGSLLNAVTLSTTFSEDDKVSQQLNQVSKIIKLRKDLQAERDVFIVTHGGYDTHNDVGDIYKGNLDEVNTALTSFVEEMKSQHIFENTVLVSTSDFGRTLTSNGQGTDHAWGGNYFILGGEVKGGQILGKYPDKLGADGSLNIGRGRILPTSSWEALWNGLSEWFGVVPGKIDQVLPNKKNFPADQLFTKNQLFKT
jgi:uncharacterized protein (DUF1800 family)/uncharacterized protein (DUF1501 family)